MAAKAEGSQPHNCPGARAKSSQPQHSGSVGGKCGRRLHRPERMGQVTAPAQRSTKVRWRVSAPAAPKRILSRAVMRETNARGKEKEGAQGGVSRQKYTIRRCLTDARRFRGLRRRRANTCANAKIKCVNRSRGRRAVWPKRMGGCASPRAKVYELCRRVKYARRFPETNGARRHRRRNQRSREMRARRRSKIAHVGRYGRRQGPVAQRAVTRPQRMAARAVRAIDRAQRR